MPSTDSPSYSTPRDENSLPAPEPGSPTSVAIVGLGSVTSAGVGVEALWEACLAGTSAVSAFGSDDDPGPVRIAALVPDSFNPKDYLTHPETRRSSRVTQLGFGAAHEAFTAAGWEDQPMPQRTQVVVGTGLGGLLIEAEEQMRILQTKGYMRMNPLAVPIMMPNSLGALISLKFGLTGATSTVSVACASSTVSLGDAARLIRSGEADRVLTGGTESLVHPTAVAAFSRMGALSQRNDDPAQASRPFDAGRDGFVMGEGAGFLALERGDLARERNADILGWVTGFGASSDAHHLVIPPEDGAGAVLAMRLALDAAGIEPQEVGHISAHGTSTEINDRAEARALHTVFGSKPPPVYGPKGVVGHLIGAAGAVEAIIATLAATHGLVPPTPNYSDPDPEVPLDVVAGEPRKIGPHIALSNSFAFGGHNASVVIVGESP